MDSESFVRRGCTLAMLLLFFYEGEDPNITKSRPLLTRQQNAIYMDDGQPLKTGLVAL